MMKKIAEGYNTHIVNMVGCVTLQEPLCLITEFIPYRDLLSYLKRQRKKVKFDVQSASKGPICTLTVLPCHSQLLKTAKSTFAADVFVFLAFHCPCFDFRIVRVGV